MNLLRASQAIGVQEERIILQASRLSAMKVKDIMMPDDDIVMVVADAPLSENLIIAHMDLHTRFPVTTRRAIPKDHRLCHVQRHGAAGQDASGQSRDS